MFFRLLQEHLEDGQFKEHMKVLDIYRQPLWLPTGKYYIGKQRRDSKLI